MSGRALRVPFVALALAGALVLAGCYRGVAPVAPEPPPPPRAEFVEPPAAEETIPSEGPGPGAPGDAAVPPVAAAPDGVPAPPEEEQAPASGGEEPPSPEAAAQEEGPGAGALEDELPPAEAAPQSPSPAGEGTEVASVPPAAETRRDVAAPETGLPAGRGTPPRIRAVVALLPEHLAFPPDGPSWARSKEELTYRVEFLGLTMGYAKFTFRGKVLLEGREAFHLTVRAWTSDVLSLLFPMNDTIEYYLDVDSLAPLRIEFSRVRKDDDIAFYDQATGTIVYRYKSNGKVRKRFEAVPGVYDPVSVGYFLRSRDLGGSEESIPMYGGKKLYEVSAQPLGHERIRTARGEFDTVVIRPVLRRGGKVDHKGDLRLWMTRDDRHLPVRLYAKFKKVRTWTLVGELLPPTQEG